MFDQLMDLIKQNGHEAVVQNPAIPNDQNEAVMKSAGHSIIDTLKNMISGGNAESVRDLFNKNNPEEISNHPVTQNASNVFSGTLMQKFGLSDQAAGSLSSGLIPSILAKLVGKTNDPNDNSFNLQSILGSLTGGGSGGNMLDRNHDGQINLGDVKSLFGK